VSTPSNVVLMQHHWLNMRELIPHLDAGILWHGTSALELGMAGVPVLVASHWGRLDHPIEFASPVDRDDYARMIRQPEAISAPPGYAERCALLSRYLATDEIMIPYPYARIPVLAPKAGQKPTLPGWNTAIVQEYLRSGDPHLDRIVSMCL
jgi:capsular polysaccharide export protein